jgi:hypothetical protein
MNKVICSLIVILSVVFSAEAGEVSPGKWTLSPDVLVAGEEVNLQLRYENGNIPLPVGSYHRVLIEPLSIKTFFHCPPSTDLAVVKFKGSLPQVELQPKPVNGVGFREVKMIFPKGLKANESFAIQIGNKQDDGSIKGLVNPISVSNLTFEIYSNLKGDSTGEEIASKGYVNPWNKTEYKELDWQIMGWDDSFPRVDIRGNKASALRVYGPSLIPVNEQFSLKIAVVDNFDNMAVPAFSGKVVLEKVGNVKGLPKRVKFSSRDKCSKIIKNLKITKSGIYRIKAKLDSSNKWVESNPIVVRKNVDTPVYWGNIHNHGQYSECWGTDLDTFFTFARDTSGMDFVAISDHLGSKPCQGCNVSRLLRWRVGKADGLEAWKDTIKKATEYNDPGKFVTLFGYEWSSMDTGHNNIYVPEAKLEEMDDYFTDRYTDYGFNMRKMLKDTEALFIPHIHADMMPYYTVVDMENSTGKSLTPVIEVYSDWGDAYFPYGQFDQHSKFGGCRNDRTESYLWAIDKGFKLGAIGDSDAHTGLPGNRTTGSTSPSHDHPQGLTAVRTSDYTRRGIMDAYHQRNVYGTTGERIFLEVKALDAIMGDELRADDPFDIHVEIAGTDQIEAVWLYRGLELIEEKKPVNQRDVTLSFKNIVPAEDEYGYVVAAVQKDGNRLYGTPIWVQKDSMPDLKFETAADGVYLVNSGKAKAKDFEVVYGAEEHPFMVDEIKGRECKWTEDAAMVWTENWDNQKTIFHFRWHGKPLNASLKIIGADSYDADTNRDFHFMKKLYKDDGEGTIEFETGKMVTVTHSQGLDIMIEISGKEKCQVVLEYDKKVKTIAGGDNIISDKVVIPINGIKSGNFSIQTISSIKPGEKIKIDSDKGYYAVDPENTVKEKDESNNLMKYNPGMSQQHTIERLNSKTAAK